MKTFLPTLSRHAISRPVLGVLFGALVLALLIALSFEARAAASDAYPYMNFNIGAQASSKTVGRKSTKKAKKKKVEASTIALVERANRELIVAAEDKTASELPTPATVRSSVEAVRSLYKPRPFRLGVSTQPFQPEGTMRVGELEPYSLDVLGNRPMVALEGQWLPLAVGGSFDLVDEAVQSGIFLSIGYAQHDIKLLSPLGSRLESTQLHSMKTQLGWTTALRFKGERPWSVRTNLGLGRIDTVQASTSAFANQTSSLVFVSGGMSAEKEIFGRWSAFGGYDLRGRLRSLQGDTSVPKHNFILGLLGNFE